jgi:hypothetical protein
VVGAALTLLACSGGGRDTPDSQRGGEALMRRPCGDLLKPAEAASAPPSDVPLAGVTWFDRRTQDGSSYHFGHLPGDQVTAARDEAIAALAAAGYAAGATADRGTAGADGQFTGPHTGAVQLTPYCKGRLQVRLELRQPS